MDQFAEKISKRIHAIFERDASLNGKAVLFGSRARGDARGGSDWDVLVLLNKERIMAADVDEISYPIRELGWELGEEINPIMFTMGEWDGKRGTPFYENVMAEGIAL